MKNKSKVTALLILLIAYLLTVAIIKERRNVKVLDSDIVKPKNKVEWKQC